MNDEATSEPDQVVIVAVGIDVGNTAVKIVTRESANPWRPTVHAFSLRDAHWVGACVSHLKQLSPTRAACFDVRVASVNRGAAKPLIDAIEDAFFDCVRIRLVTHVEVGMTVEVRHPERVGIDRVLAAAAASRRHALPLVIVDAGTTVTVDWVSPEGTFCGGAIFPGLEMQVAALAAGTDGLPKIHWDEQPESAEIPGRDTVAAIRLGVLSSVVGAVERLVRLYGQTHGQSLATPCTLVVTGGDAICIVDALPLELAAVEEPHLVSRALLDLAETH